MTPEQEQALATIRSWPPQLQEMWVAEMRERIRRMKAPPAGRPTRWICDCRQDPNWHAYTLLHPLR